MIGTQSQAAGWIQRSSGSRSGAELQIRLAS